jgi:hypothetical protein
VGFLAEFRCEDVMFELLLDPPKYRWPQKTDRLFVPPVSPERGTCTADDTLAREVFMGSGYMRAGAVLVERCLADPQHGHELIYPIVFNYRHALELEIKWVLDRYGRYAAIQEFERNHNLAQLWKVCRQVIEEIGGPSDDGALETVERIVLELHALDPSSFAFRYSTDKNGRPIPLNLSVDLENIRDVMEGVENFFQGVDGQLDHNSSAVDHDYYY